VFRLYRVVDPAFKTHIPMKIRKDMGVFLDEMKSESVNLKNLGINDQGLESILVSFEDYIRNSALLVNATR
jgi:hypothetical protein